MWNILAAKESLKSSFFLALMRMFLYNKNKRSTEVVTINNEYEKIASRYLFTDMAITNLQLDRSHLEHSPCKIKAPYFQAIDALISTAIQERKRLKSLMHQHNIQIEHMKSDRLFSTYNYYLNGYVHEVSYFNPVIKKYVTGIMRELFIKTTSKRNSTVNSDHYTR